MYIYIFRVHNISIICIFGIIFFDQKNVRPDTFSITFFRSLYFRSLGFRPDNPHPTYMIIKNQNIELEMYKVPNQCNALRMTSGNHK